MKNDSNYTLRFSRTAREEFGHDIRFDEPHRGDKAVAIVAAIAAAFVTGMVVGKYEVLNDDKPQTAPRCDQQRVFLPVMPEYSAGAGKKTAI